MKQGTQGKFEVFDASGYKIGIVVAQFNHEITEQMLENCIGAMTHYEISKDRIFISRVAGSVEIPVILQKLAETKKFDCLVAIGAIIRGETPHFDYVAKIVAEGITRVMLDYGIPIGFAVLTTENHEQASSRVSVGGEAAIAAINSTKIIKDKQYEPV